jgi:hypothetical protein
MRLQQNILKIKGDPVSTEQNKENQRNFFTV